MRQRTTNEVGLDIPTFLSHETEFEDGTETRSPGWIKTKGPHDYYVRAQMPWSNKVHNLGWRADSPDEPGKLALTAKEKPYKMLKLIAGRGQRGYRDV